jgi:hypothetical protein
MKFKIRKELQGENIVIDVYRGKGTKGTFA